MNFKAQLQADLARVFHNGAEFAEEKAFYYDGKRICAPVVLDSAITQDRKQLTNDYAQGIFVCDLTMYVPLEYFPKIPRKGRQLEMNDTIYTINKVSSEDGEIVLYLEVHDE